MTNPGDTLAEAVLAFLESGATDIYGLATAYAWYAKQCGDDVNALELAKESINV